MDDPTLLEWAAEFLTSLCAVNTSITSDIDRLRLSEKQCFDICARQLDSFPENRSIPILPQMLPIDAASIRKDPDYTIPYYAEHLKDDPEKIYHGRFGMLVSMGDDGPENSKNRWILNAHIDTVAPHIPPRKIDRESILGRGTTDNKGGVACAVMVARLLTAAVREEIITVLPSLDLILVTDEESGGNGALSAITRLKPTAGPVVVLEPTGLRPHPANRGALWFKMELTAEDEKTADILLMAAAHVVKAVENAGMDIKLKSRHPLFSRDDIQTCFGILGGYGKHPSSACTNLHIEVTAKNGKLNESDLQNSMISAFDAALLAGEFTHKTEYPHIEAGGGGNSPLRLQFKSIGGHMGSKDRDSDAITKAASTITRMGQNKNLFFNLPGRPHTINLEGGQGFLPDRTIKDVKEKITLAVESALHDFRSAHAMADAQLHASISFDKLHNNAYCSDKSNGATLLAGAVHQLTGINPGPLHGWQASCDARLFAKKFSDVVTFGAGRLQDAHQDNEQIHLPDLITAAAAITLAILTSRSEQQ